MESGGKYENITAVYHQNACMKKVGPWDRELIGAMPPTVKWIAHKGAGYDMIDVNACKDRGVWHHKHLNCLSLL
jgi:glyoxylate reductase